MKKSTIAIVLAAGCGKRMNSDVKKQYMEINEKPILYYTLKSMENDLIDEIILVTSKEDEAYCRETFIKNYGFSKIKAIVCGGRERYHSVYNALKWLSENKMTDSYVLIHDGARPFVSDELLERLYDMVKKTSACVLGVRVKDTIKIANDKGRIQSTPDRDSLWAIQTPQAFLYTEIKAAYDKLMEQEEKGCLQYNVTDDAMVMEHFGRLNVYIAQGSYENIKITTPEDILTAGQILDRMSGVKPENF